MTARKDHIFFKRSIIVKILYVTGTNTYSAGNRVLTSWIDFLRSRNFNILVASPPGGSLSGELKKRLPSSNILFCSFPFPSPRNFYYFIKNFFQVLKFVSHHRPDIIHCNGEDIYVMMRYIAKILDIPIIIHLHFHWPDSFYSWLFKRNFKPSLIFTVSHALFEEETSKLKKVIHDLDCVKVLPNCIDIDKQNIPNTSFNFSDNAKYRLAVVAAIQKRKGQHYAIQFASRLIKKIDNFALYFAGRVKEEKYYKACLNILESEQSVKSKIYFLGFVSQIFSFIKNCDLVISFSSYETFGMTVLESMALGTPVIGFSVPAVEEVLGCNFLTVPFGDLEALVDLAYRILNDSAYRLSIREYLKERAMAFTPEKIVPQLIENYKKIL